MSGLLDFLNTPEAQLGIGLLAYSGDMGRPMGFGERIAGAIGSTQKQQQAAEEKKLRAGLLEAQMGELQSKAAQRDRVQGMLGGLFGAPTTNMGGGSNVAPEAAPAQGGAQGLRGVPIERIAALKAAGGPDLIEAWKQVNVPTSMAAGSYAMIPGQAPQYMADPSKGLGIGPQGVYMLPGADTAAAKLAGAAEEAKQRANDPREFVEITGPDGSKGMISRSEAMRRTQPAIGAQGVGYTGQPMVDAVMHTESRGAPGAVSPAGARGTMQTMPGTLSAPGFGVAPARDGTAQEQQRVGVDYWNAMTKRYSDPALAAVAYNWGPGNADKWLAEGADFRKLPKETQDYVGQVMLRNGYNATRGAGSAPTSGAIPTGLSTEQQAQNEAAKAGLVARATDTAKADVVRDTDMQKKAKSANSMIAAADRALELLQQGPTASGFGEMVDKGAAFVGRSTPGAQVAAQLDIVAGDLVNNVPRMEGPQSDGDRLEYRTQAGRAADRNLPVAQRTAAMHEVKRLQSKYAPLNGGESPPSEQAKPTTFEAMPSAAQYKGRRIRGDDGRVLQSDGMSWKEVR